MSIYGLNKDLSNLPRQVQRTSLSLMACRDQFDSVVVRGVSGLIVGAPVALAIDAPLVVVRKPAESTHDPALVVNERYLGRKAVFVDDFRFSGCTEAVVKDAIEPLGAEVWLCFFYDRDGWTQPLDANVLSLGREEAKRMQKAWYEARRKEEAGKTDVVEHPMFDFTIREIPKMQAPPPQRILGYVPGYAKWGDAPFSPVDGRMDLEITPF
jgi:orotate phosphoribosyltransferase